MQVAPPSLPPPLKLRRSKKATEEEGQICFVKEVEIVEIVEQFYS
jgi:hypothetical protein